MNRDSKEIPKEIRAKFMTLNMTGKDEEMTESAVEVEVVASKSFYHSDDHVSGMVEATLYSDWRLELKRSDDYVVKYNFTPLVSDEDQLMFFDALATPESYERFKYDRSIEINFTEADLVHLLMKNQLPANLAIRLALVANLLEEDGEALFESYRNLKQGFFYNRKTGQSSFEMYMLMVKQFGIPFADSVFKLKATSFETLEAAFNELKTVRLHGDARGAIALTTPESFETFLVLKRLMRTDKKQDAMVLVRLAADDGSINWTTVTELNRALKIGQNISDLVAPEEASLAELVQTYEQRNMLLRQLYDRPNPDAISTIFAVLIAKYGIAPILQALNRINEDPLTTGTLASFIVVTDFIGQTGDADTNLQWILLLSGDMDEENFQ